MKKILWKCILGMLLASVILGGCVANDPGELPDAPLPEETDTALEDDRVVLLGDSTLTEIPWIEAATTINRNGEEVFVAYSWAKYDGVLRATSSSEYYSVAPLWGSGRYLTVIFDMGYTYLLDTTTGEVLDPLSALPQDATMRIHMVNFTPDGQYAVISHHSAMECILLNCTTGEITELPYPSDVYYVCGYMLDETHVMLTTGFETDTPGTIEYHRQIVDIETGEVAELPEPYQMTDKSAPNYLFDLGDGGRYAYTYDENGTLVIVDQVSWERVVTQFLKSDVDGFFYYPNAWAGVVCDGLRYIITG